MLKIRAYVVILIIQFIVMAFCLIYAFVQRTMAIKNEAQANYQSEESQALRMEMEKRVVLLESELEKCKGSK